ncbi:hypothetical protein OS493_016714 [Desmophyllum pertusum]|uniref:beta-N-acetylhexosaminidase n=1 Tax=Desmophyllum pertusum TaxID=174260 RepID=A0A9X0CRB0_9CNID|nr:hypothetical protein OS493_016714 [Desmophyllum pertusum]
MEQDTKKRKAFFGTGDWIVVAPKELDTEAQYLAKKLGINEVTTGASRRIFRIILLRIDCVEIRGKDTTNQEAYKLQVNTDKMTIEITGLTAAGVFWGVQTLLSITHEGRVPSVVIHDEPRFEYRGMSLDVARNFVAKEEIFKLMEVMAMYKLNKLHFHLTDDEGWRLEIPDLPELTEIGGKRCHDPRERECIASQLGSGPFTGNSGSGFYSASDYCDILQYARERHIQLIPEFDMPGHAHAAIKAMDAKFENFSSNGNLKEAEMYRLSDKDDESKYLSAQNFKDNSINPCLESTYNFIDKVVRGVQHLHSGIQPLTIFHFGGDEVPLGAWTGSPACKRLAKRQGFDSGKDIVKDLMGYFVSRVSNITHQHGLDLAAWEDGLMGTSEKPYKRDMLFNKRVYANTWDNVWEFGKANRPYKLANTGYKVVMTQATHLFFDHPYEPDPEERGYYWATRFTNTRKTFGFMPDNLYANADTKRNGEPIKNLCANMYKNKCVSLEKPENIAGMSGAFWSETVRTPEQLHSLIHPRLLALAERAWHKAEWENKTDKAERDRVQAEDWERFSNTLGYKELARLDKLNIKYHLPPPGAIVQDGRLKASAIIPGLRVQYTTDNGHTWRDVSDETLVSRNVKIGTRSADRRRISRLVEIKYQKKITRSDSGKMLPNMELCLLLLMSLMLS